MTKFIYVESKGGDKPDSICIADNKYQYTPGASWFNLDSFSTADLLKLKAQLSTVLENRMDVDEVNATMLEKLQLMMKNASMETLAQLLRQQLDREDTVSADEKRVKARKQMILNEVQRRMIDQGIDKLEFNGFVNITNKVVTQYSVNAEQWTDFYNSIIDEANQCRKDGRPVDEAFSVLQKRAKVTTLAELAKAGYALPAGVEARQEYEVKALRNKKSK